MTGLLYRQREDRVPHISLVFREMWDTTLLDVQVYRLSSRLPRRPWGEADLSRLPRRAIGIGHSEASEGVSLLQEDAVRGKYTLRAGVPAVVVACTKDHSIQIIHGDRADGGQSDATNFGVGTFDAFSAELQFDVGLCSFYTGVSSGIRVHQLPRDARRAQRRYRRLAEQRRLGTEYRVVGFSQPLLQRRKQSNPSCR
jgi:hypothetical protein